MNESKSKRTRRMLKSSRQLVKEIESREKCLCILVNNAGIAAGKTATQAESVEELRKNLFDPTT